VALLKEAGSNAQAVGVNEAAQSSLFATPWPATEAAIRSAGNLAGKIMPDCTNPLKPDLSVEIGHTLLEPSGSLAGRKDREW
jgi:predicted dinucleotide-binding enzyme